MQPKEERLAPVDDPLWYKDAIIYELHVRAFSDSNADGVGDFRGLTERLDYLQDLGVTTIWLLPFYPSPLKDDGYDIADYTGVNPMYGTPREFRQFVREAHRRGLRVITELVCNHTSDEHPWFQRACRARPGTVARDFYVWSDTPDRYREARIIFKDFESSNWSWDRVAGAYYWHRFYSHQPDLNYDNPHVRAAILRAMDFWLQGGVDGLRLDAVPYLYEREGTNCENLPETHAALKELRAHVDRRFKARMLLAEANQWPEQAVAYFGHGDECHMAFHFPLMPRMFMAIRMENRFPIIDILAQTPAIPDNCQWALFLRNHDELTLEMVTDEERDYMYRVYAQDPEARINLGIRRRLAPLLGNDRRRIELMNLLLFSMPGTPVIYYGDEIGMGDNIYLGDRDSVRTPMQWSSDRNAGFSRANPQRLYLPVITDPEYHYETVQVQAEQDNPHSLLWWMKRLIALRKRYRAFGRGSLEFLYPENRRVLCYIRRYQEETILVVANLSRFVQYVELGLEEFRGRVPVELWGQTEFPPVRDQPYFLTLGPHACFWFSLEPQRVGVVRALGAEPGTAVMALVVGNGQHAGSRDLAPLLLGKSGIPIAEALSSYLEDRHWMSVAGRRVKAPRILDVVSVRHDGAAGYLTLVQIEFAGGEAETYVVPLAYADGEKAVRLLRESPRSAIARLRLEASGEEGVLYDALEDEEFSVALLGAVAGRRRLKGARGELLASPSRALRMMKGLRQKPLEPTAIRVNGATAAVVFGDRFVLKLHRRLEEGINPDAELGRFLTERGSSHAPPLAGVLEYREERGEPATVAVVQGFVPNEGTAWQHSLDALSRFFEQDLASRAARRAEVGSEAPVPPPPIASLLDLMHEDPPPPALERIGGYLEWARLLGQRIAELHLELASAEEGSVFAPEPFTSFYRRSVYQTMRSLALQVFPALRRRLDSLPVPVQADARKVLDLEAEILRRFRLVADHRIDAMRIRCHGDLRLEDLVYTGGDFVVVDLKGESSRPISERRIKRSPLRDVASLLCSFHYAAHMPLLEPMGGLMIRPEDVSSLETCAHYWYRWVGATFLKGYLAAAADAPFLPRTRHELQILMGAFLLEKGLADLGDELNRRPRWVVVPTHGIIQVLEAW